DQLFIGVDPKREEGREYFIYCTDYLYPVCDLIATYCNPELVPIPQLDESDCVQLSECLDNLVKKGTAKTFFREDAKHWEMSRTETKSYVETLLAYVTGFSMFLKDCGGCLAEGY